MKRRQFLAWGATASVATVMAGSCRTSSQETFISPYPPRRSKTGKRLARELSADVVIVGGGVGGCAAASSE